MIDFRSFFCSNICIRHYKFYTKLRLHCSLKFNNFFFIFTELKMFLKRLLRFSSWIRVLFKMLFSLLVFGAFFCCLVVIGFSFNSIVIRKQTLCEF